MSKNMIYKTSPNTPYIAHKSIYIPTSILYLTSLLTLRSPLISLHSNTDISLIYPDTRNTINAPSVILFHPYGDHSLHILDQSIHIHPLLHVYHQCNILTYFNHITL